MPMPDTLQAVAGPSPAPTAANPSPAQGIQPGGTDPQMEQALASVHPDAAQVIRERLKAVDTRMTQQSMSMADSVRKAAVLDQIVADPGFSDWKRARETGDLAGYHRRSLGLSEQQPLQPAATGHPDIPTGPPAHGEQPQAPSAELAALNARITEQDQVIQQNQASLQTMRGQNTANTMDVENPGWRDYMPEILEKVASAPGLTPQDAYFLVSRDPKPAPVSAGVVSSGGGEQQTQGQLPPQSPPPPVSEGGVGIPTLQSRTYDKENMLVGLGQAWADAEKTHGVKIAP